MEIGGCVSVCIVIPDSYLVHFMTLIVSYLTVQSQTLIHVIDCLNCLVFRPFLDGF